MADDCKGSMLLDWRELAVGATLRLVFARYELISQRAGSTEPRRMSSDHAVVCCHNARKALKEAPVTVQLPTYFHVRLTAGDYDFFVRTQRVSGPKPAKYYSDNPTVTSEGLHIEVRPISRH